MCGKTEQMSKSLDIYYRILGLAGSASKDDVKRAYRRLALKHHPDKNPGNEDLSARVFIEISRAYSVLVDRAHVGEVFEDVEDAKLYLKRQFYNLTRRIDGSDYLSDEISQEECDFFFRYQLEEVACVRRSTMEARRIVDLVRKAVSRGYDVSEILKDHSDFFQKYDSEGWSEYDGFAELVAQYRSIIAAEPGNAEAHCNLGIVYEKLGRIEAAISQYQMALYIDPDSPRAKRAAERLTQRTGRIF